MSGYRSPSGARSTPNAAGVGPTWLACIVLLAGACAAPAPTGPKPMAPAAPPPLPPRAAPAPIWHWTLATTAEQSLQLRPWWSDPGYAPLRSAELPDDMQPDFEPRTFDPRQDSTTAVCRLKAPGRSIEGGLFARERGPALQRRAPWPRREHMVLPLWSLSPGERMQVTQSVPDESGTSRDAVVWEGRFDGQLPWSLEPQLPNRDPGECTFLTKRALGSILDALATRALEAMKMTDDPADFAALALVTEEDLARTAQYGYRKQLLDAVASFTGWAEPALQPLVVELTQSLDEAARSLPDRFGRIWDGAPPAADAGLERVDCDPERVWGPDDKLGAVLEIVVTLGLSNPNRKKPGRCVLVFGDKVSLREPSLVLDKKRSHYLKARTIPDASKFGRSGPATVGVVDFGAGERDDVQRLLRVGEKYYRMPAIDFTH